MSDLFCEITLSQRFPKQLGIFDYSVPGHLQPAIRHGQLVHIPFRNSVREGVVIRLKKQSIAGKKIKPITDIIRPNPILTSEQLQLAEWLAQKYFVSIGSVIKMILPPLPARKPTISDNLTAETILTTDNAFLKNAIHALILSKEKHWFYQPSRTEETRICIKNLIASANGTILIIVPTIQDIDDIRPLVPASDADRVTLFHGNLGKHQHYQAYETIRTASVRIVIGTKLSLFLPFQNLRYIVLTQSENRNHKQSDQNPRYDARTVALKLSDLHNAKTIFCSHAPTVEQYKLIQDKTWIRLTDPHTDDSRPYHIVDMREERKKRQSRILSETLIDEMKDSLAKKSTVFLYANRRGSSSSVVCGDCGLAIVCPECQQPLVYHGQSKMLFCHQCNVKYPLPLTCKKCGGVHLRFHGTGAQQVEQEVKKYWPNTSVIRLDQDAEKPASTLTADIVIGTELAIPYVDWDRVGVTGVINADSLLYLPDFRSSERTWQQITLFHYLTGQPCVIQTNTPDYPVMNALGKNEPELLYRQELTDRMLLNYPPYTRLVKLIVSHPDKNRCVQEAQRVYRMFQPSRVFASILTPLRPFIRKRWYMYLILKIPYSMNEDKINLLISQVPVGWQIDRDPINLL
ncbi:MAG: primosomal protein N' [Patescibacteria group bacterium]